MKKSEKAELEGRIHMLEQEKLLWFPKACIAQELYNRVSDSSLFADASTARAALTDFYYNWKEIEQYG